jgi:D-alanyl-D-alanine carboxypeptidase
MMSKTGYTDLAGGNLAVVFDAGIGHPVAVVVLGSTKEERFTDVQRLVRATSAQFAGLRLP